MISSETPRRKSGPIAYKRDEKLLADWRPALPLFLSKLALVAVLTLAVLGPLFVTYNLFAWLGSAVASMLLYVFLFDDHLEWFRRRDDVWILTDQRLIFANPDDDNSPAYVHLAQITRVRRFMWWAVNVKLDNGMTTTLKYVPNGKLVQQSIRAARDNIAPHFPK
ncbi:hypothetical protein [Shimia thalassica]|uniref:hypothetical protein n=1 Tax=Shimia thalassica TaxID=1715693 RepID=UPI0026E2C8EA|nr:hypothetical protein [Shimia thalassica]